jgi:glycosyltransferase involved in cell wall biosynthesis
MSRLETLEHVYTLYLKSPWPTPESSPVSNSTSAWRVALLHPPRLWAQIRLPLEFWQHPQDVYFFPSAVLPLVYQPAKSIITIHDVAFLFFPECFSFALRHWLALATKIGMNRARKIIAVSEATRRDVIRHYGIAPDKVVTIHHGTHERFRPIDDADAIRTITKKYGIERQYILCIGTLQRRKNIPRLLQAFARLKHTDHIPHQFVLVGQQHADLPEDEIFTAIHQLVLQQDVIWTGYVDQEDIPYVLNGADLFVLPSLYEGFGMPLLEAMACGVPVACSDVSSLPEVVGESGVRFDPENVESIASTISRILNDEALQKTLRTEGLQRARDFSWEICARKTLNVLEEVGNA